MNVAIIIPLRVVRKTAYAEKLLFDAYEKLNRKINADGLRDSSGPPDGGL